MTPSSGEWELTRLVGVYCVLHSGSIHIYTVMLSMGRFIVIPSAAGWMASVFSFVGLNPCLYVSCVLFRFPLNLANTCFWI